ncbi:tetratricopeptide repeat protein [Baia soyae]|uniref:Tetratricopeptide repeat protein n=1 Tax=Baia soyae TaxID=1544746 RepID=A0A4R2S3W7_9BACL|nr:tetratricopeptide repeat protein [Baia soyae]TCP70372.1 tetratricopeptide repeat protein [Baia soyae]
MHLQNELHSSLKAIEIGLKSFQSDGERSHLAYMLTIMKASVLEKLDRNAEALQLVEETWENRGNYVWFSNGLLNLIQIRVELLNKMGLYEKAIPIAKEGLTFAKLDSNIDRIFELLSSLGEANAGIGKLQVAKLYYQKANELESKISRKSLAITTYTQLGKVYSRQGEWKMAETNLKHAVKIGDDDEYRLCKALTALGDLYYRREQYEKAYPVLEQAWKIAQKSTLDESACDILLLLSSVSKHLRSTEYTNYTDTLVDVLTLVRKEGGKIMTNFVNDPPME